DIIDKIRIGYQDEESKFALSSNEKETYTQAIDIAVELYELTKNPIYKEKAFRYAERSKAASLMSSLNDVNAKNFAGIPVELQEEELHLRKNIAKYREKVYEERRKAQPNREKIAKWQTKLFELNESYDQMVLRFEEEYPEYYALKYSHKTIELSELQSRLASDETLIEYSISDSALFTFIVTADSFEITKQDIHDLNLDHHIEEVRNALKTNDFGENSSEYYKRYTKSAYELYKIFVAPHDKAIQNKKLIIVPDGKMAYVPFGVLIKSEANSNRMNYRDLDYLIKSHTITYQNSATIGFTIESAGFSILSSKSVLAFAPSYKGVDDSILYTERAYRDKLYPLPYTKEEVNNISNVMKGDLYLDDLATEQNFKNNASNYDVLHLAMHTIIDDENPMYSKLVFTQTNDTIQDGLLNTHEIYNMNFNARMVVLSACNTGDGKLLKGEGVMSLARGFFYAGCPSIIMTLWTVEDQTGSNLMTNFYANLSEGLQKDQALRNAKLKYLETADPLKSHPYFWSGYVTMGDVEPLYNLSMKNNLVYMGLGGLVLLVLFVFRRKIVRRKTA
ncbi:MAG: CHAT domain-containing protein, partial [Marinifilum sp.]|nr:CHAT domain-containing protein [Marinifilum sp.]